MEVGNFERLEVFEDNNVNKTIDYIYDLANGNLAVCGSVAKILDGLKDENYNPKDIDLLCRDKYLWRFLTANCNKFETISTEIEPFRIKLFFPTGFLVEIWNEKLPFTKEGIYKNKIKYCYAD